MNYFVVLILCTKFRGIYILKVSSWALSWFSWGLSLPYSVMGQSKQFWGTLRYDLFGELLKQTWLLWKCYTASMIWWAKIYGCRLILTLSLLNCKFLELLWLFRMQSKGRYSFIFVTISISSSILNSRASAALWTSERRTLLVTAFNLNLSFSYKLIVASYNLRYALYLRQIVRHMIIRLVILQTFLCLELESF